MSPNRFACLGEALLKRPLAFSAAFALAAVLLASAYLSRREADLAQIAEPAPVVVAAADLPEGEAINPSDLQVIKIPRRFVEPGALSDLGDADGRVAAVAISKGAQLTRAIARGVGELSRLSAAIPLGRRAAVVPIDGSSGMASQIKLGDAVDVIATFDLGVESSVRRTTMTIVEDVQVLAVGDEILDGVKKSSSRREKKGMFGLGSAPGSMNAQSVALAVTPAEAQALAFAKESGALALALRPLGEGGDEARTPPTTIATITGGHEDLLPIKRGFREYRGR